MKLTEAEIKQEYERNLAQEIRNFKVQHHIRESQSTLSDRWEGFRDIGGVFIRPIEYGYAVVSPVDGFRFVIATYEDKGTATPTKHCGYLVTGETLALNTLRSISKDTVDKIEDRKAKAQARKEQKQKSV